MEKAKKEADAFAKIRSNHFKQTVRARPAPPRSRRRLDLSRLGIPLAVLVLYCAPAV